MKKFKMYLFFYVLTSCLLFASCSADINDNVQSSKNAFNNSKLVQELSLINSQLLDSNENKIMRGGIPKWVNVTVHDVIGAFSGGKAGAAMGGKIGTLLGSPITGGVFGGFLGAVGFGAYRSASQYYSTCTYACTAEDFQNNFINSASQLIDHYYDDLKMEKSINERDIDFVSDSLCKQINIDEPILESVKLKNRHLCVGKLHNIILSSLENNKSEGVMRGLTNNYGCGDNVTFSYVSSHMDWDEFYAEANKMVEKVELGDTNSKIDYVMTLFTNIFSIYSSEIDDVVVLINKYATVVNASDELSEEEKDYILYGLATALYSFNYWKVEYLK